MNSVPISDPDRLAIPTIASARLAAPFVVCSSPSLS